jgi:hypothetical protein
VGDAAIAVEDPTATATSVDVPLAELAGMDPAAYPVRVVANGAQSTEDVSFTLS